MCVCSLLLSDANLTTERTEAKHGSSAGGGAGEGVSVGNKAGVGFLLERKIVLHRAADGARSHVDGGIRRQRDIDVAGVVDQLIFAAARGIAIIADAALRG